MCSSACITHFLRKVQQPFQVRGKAIDRGHQHLVCTGFFVEQDFLQLDQVFGLSMRLAEETVAFSTEV